MDRVEGWIGDFFVKHTVRCPREDWPAPATEDESTTLDAWKHAFVTRGVERRFADVASLDMAAAPPRFLSEHLPELVRLALELRRAEDAVPGADPLTSLEAATIASRGCPDCGGSGGAVRYVHPGIHGKVRTFGGHVAPVGMAVTYPCSCPLGRFVARGLRQEGQASDPLTVDQYPSLRMGRVSWSDAPDNRHRHRPESWDHEWDMPGGAGEVLDVAGLEALVASLAASKDAPGRFVPSPPRGRATDDARAVPARSDLASAIPDPVIGRERAPALASRPDSIGIPEDQAALGWY